MEQQAIELKKAAKDKLALVVLDEYVLVLPLLYFCEIFIVLVLSVVASGTESTNCRLPASTKTPNPSF